MLHPLLCQSEKEASPMSQHFPKLCFTHTLTLWGSEEDGEVPGEVM